MGFDTTAGFSADATNAPKGVNPGEHVTIVFNLISNQTVQSVIDALSLPATTTGSLRIGIKGQGFGTNDGSEAFINNPPNNPPVVPLPAAAWGGLALLGTLGVSKRMRDRRSAE